MAKSGMVISIERRPAEVTIPIGLKKALCLLDNKHLCNVCGPFQESDGDWAGPVFVCELDDGRVFTTIVENVRFVDTIGEMEQCT